MATIREIASAIADELQLNSTDRISVKEVTVSVTYQVDQFAGSTWLDDWFRESFADEVPFRSEEEG